ncbi:class I SAM-dependent methyltransferase [Streptomyces sp. NPDC058665]|uniref:class I SAM-dependent methyltransferase n=1 Tax=Streptomyces sp. NPDC058665 TaxID=3346586 RepID=UPI003662755B
MGRDRTFHIASSREPDARTGPDPGSSPGPGPPCDLDGPESHLEVSAPPDRADVCCGTGELTVFLTSLGYRVDGADFTEGVLERARTEHVQVKGVRWLCLDIENDDLATLADDGYDLITLRLGIAHIQNRAGVLRRLAARLKTRI